MKATTLRFGAAPRQQAAWDWRAAGNFMAGGAGSGLIVLTGWPSAGGWPLALGLALVVLGLCCVWLEIGRPWRALNVFLNPRRSWMSREAIAALLLMPAGAAALLGVPGAGWLCAPLALAFLGCQAGILHAARGIPAWREPRLVPLIVSTGLAEGGGLLLLVALVHGLALPRLSAVITLLALLVRLAAWRAWRLRLRTDERALREIDRHAVRFIASTLAAVIALVALLVAPPPEAAAALLQAAAGLLAVAGGQGFKFMLVTRAAFTPGFVLPHRPVRGAAR
jgi:phenylacetyl-CoA:acceptor oxidoreductase 26-kDa subunit